MSKIRSTFLIHCFVFAYHHFTNLFIVFGFRFYWVFETIIMLITFSKTERMTQNSLYCSNFSNFTNLKGTLEPNQEVKYFEIYKKKDRIWFNSTMNFPEVERIRSKTSITEGVGMEESKKIWLIPFASLVFIYKWERP